MSISQPQLDVEQEMGGCVEDVKSSWLLVSRHSAVWRVTRHTLQVVLFSRDSPLRDVIDPDKDIGFLDIATPGEVVEPTE